MNSHKTKIISLVGFSLIVLVGFWTSTQLIASSLGYHPSLGKPLMHFLGTPIYWPWWCFKWILAFSSQRPAAFQSQLNPIFFATILAVVWLILVQRFGFRKGEEGLTSHGSARWANNKDIERSGLLAGEGVMLGLTSDRKRYLRHNGPEHICVFAPTRSGKGVGLVVPTLLSWTNSLVCFDPKGENWKITSGFREKFSKCIYFNPSSTLSARFNPLMEVRLGENEVKDAQNIADMLVDPNGAERRQSHWERTAHALLVGAILHVLYSEENKTLNGLANFLANPNRTISETLKAMLETRHLGNAPHPVVASSARELLNKASEELSGVVSTAVSFLSLYRDPVVAHATSASDFRIQDLLAEKPLSLFLVVPPSDISRTKPLMRLIINQIGRILTETPPQENANKRLLLMLDEFPALGRLDFFETSLAYLAGYGIKAFLITQSLNQIEATYGANNSILDNCHIRIAFASNDERTAKRISDLIGTKTGLKEQESVSGKAGALMHTSKSVSFQEYGRPLLNAAEVMQLPDSDEIVLVAGCPPIRAKKLRYFEDPAFSKRVIAPVPLSSAFDLAHFNATASTPKMSGEDEPTGSDSREVDITGTKWTIRGASL